jgi:hypothetical protein
VDIFGQLHAVRQQLRGVLANLDGVGEHQGVHAILALGIWDVFKAKVQAENHVGLHCLAALGVQVVARLLELDAHL